MGLHRDDATDVRRDAAAVAARGGSELRLHEPADCPVGGAEEIAQLFLMMHFVSSLLTSIRISCASIWRITRPMPRPWDRRCPKPRSWMPTDMAFITTSPISSMVPVAC